MSLGPHDTLIINEKLRVADNDQLLKELDEAKARLAGLKTDNVVFARTRTVKRILDHVKVEGAVNLSQNARNRIYQQGGQHSDTLVISEAGQQTLHVKQEHLGPLITKLKDEYDERNREIIQKSGQIYSRVL